MITKENLIDVIHQIDVPDKHRIINSSKEFVVLQVHVFNTGSITTVRLTNNVKHTLHYGDAILDTYEVIEIINDLKNNDRSKDMIEENIANSYKHLTGRNNRAAIFAHFRYYDQSNLFPIQNSYNVTERAIQRLHRWEKQSGDYLQSFELCYWLSAEISEMVNHEA